jgi:glycosyltransferase involved in cell wall biosynthesis
VKRLLLVSYYFPPLGGSGVFRALRLAKYLPRAGWSVSVVTVDARVRALKDPSLAADVPPETTVVRARSIEPRTPLIALHRAGLGRLARRIEPWFLLPDDQRGWVPFARRAALRLLRRERHDAVVTTAGPYSAHLVGLGLERATGIPWIADFRDEWTANPYLGERYPTAWHRRWNRAREREVLRGADRVTCVSRPWLDGLREAAPGEPAEKFAVLPNGFDGEHFPEAPGPRPDLFRIVYTGAFYGHRSPRHFLDAVHRLLHGGRVPSSDLEVVLMGHAGAGAARPEASDLVRPVLRVAGHRPYREALDQLQRAAVLLLVVPREGGPGNHTGKLFPYLAAGRPILALAPEPNVAADLVRESRAGVVVPPDDAAAIAGALERLYGDWKSGATPPARDESVIARYEASRQARDWARLLDSL